MTLEKLAYSMKLTDDGRKLSDRDAEVHHPSSLHMNYRHTTTTYHVVCTVLKWLTLVFWFFSSKNYARKVFLGHLVPWCSCTSRTPELTIRTMSFSASPSGTALPNEMPSYKGNNFLT